MVFGRRQVDPAQKQAIINVSLSASPTLFLSDADGRLEVKLDLSVAWAREGREGMPLTFSTKKSVFDVTEPGEGGIDVFGQGGFGRLRSASHDNSKHISLDLFRIRGFDKSDSPDLRERGWRFVTVPGGPGAVATVTHELPWERIFRYEGKRTKEDLVPGEKFKIAFDRHVAGTLWWCWGDLQTDLKDKRLHMWHEPPRQYEGGEKPDDDFVREGNWVLGEDPDLLDWEDVTPGGEAVIEIVE